MANPIIRVHDLKTNEIVDRPMTAAEYKQYMAVVASEERQREEAATAAAAKQAILDRLGLTAEEAALLLS